MNQHDHHHHHQRDSNCCHHHSHHQTPSSPSSSSSTPKTKDPQPTTFQQQQQSPNTIKADKAALEKHREQLVRNVVSNTKLTLEEKRAKVHSIMMGRYTSQNAIANDGGDIDESKKDNEQICEKTYHNKEKGILGCKHYARKCRMKAACCGKYVGCRICHGEVVGRSHDIDRTKTEVVGCMECGAMDVPAGECCEKCGVRFASYYCGKCKFWDDEVVVGDGDEVGKRIFHCDGCGACRVGRGLGIDNEHCGKCGTCYPKSGFGKHKCVERSLETNCPICTEYLADSREEVKFFIRCGHAMHISCYEKHIKSSFTCPICKKTWRDMNYIFRRLDKKVKEDWKNMPEEYRNKVASVLCQDCQKVSEAKYHFIYHKCGLCSSYNTRMVKVYEQKEKKDEGKSDEENKDKEEETATAENGQVACESLVKNTEGASEISGDRQLLVERVESGR